MFGWDASWLVEVISCLFHSACQAAIIHASFQGLHEISQPNTSSTLLIKVRSPNYLGNVTINTEGGQNNWTTYIIVLFDEITLFLREESTHLRP